MQSSMRGNALGLAPGRPADRRLMGLLLHGAEHAAFAEEACASPNAERTFIMVGASTLCLRRNWVLGTVQMLTRSPRSAPHA
jgi:hypothetical protein